jgi:hypothetical protein
VGDHLQDHLAQAEEPLAQRPVIGLDLPDAPALDSDLFQGGRRPLEVRREDDEVIDVRDAVGVMRLGPRRPGGRGQGQAVDLRDLAGAQPPAEDALAGREVEVDGADPGRVSVEREPGALPSSGIRTNRELLDLDLSLRSPT